MNLAIDKDILLKYDVPGPRYTSYPTAPTWTSEVNEATYIEKLSCFGQSNRTLSLYVHIPFCQTMCTFCACSVVIRKKDQKYGDEYLEHLFKEIDLVRKHIGISKVIKQFHWGGGTPTYLNENQIERLFRKIAENFTFDCDAEIAIEIDPRTIDKNKVKKLRELGFNRISMGVQDFDGKVQSEVNRIQSFEMVQEFYNYCRELKFHSVNFDLIYGLPLQTVESFHDTVEKVIRLRPDRIALYSFAYVPWLKKHQTKIRPEDLPTLDQKLDIFLNSRDQFLDAGYQGIAMDHFALKSDELTKSFNEGQLYRNFMGYTVNPADEFVGLGVSSIGYIENTYVQNFKVLPQYYQCLKAGHLPLDRGKVLSRDDQIRQFTINSLMCQFHLDKQKFRNYFHINFDEYFSVEQAHLQDCSENGLIVMSSDRIDVTELGKIFVRNVCMGFDHYLKEKGAFQQFSQTV